MTLDRLTLHSRRTRLTARALLAVACLLAPSMLAAQVADATGDFLASFTGTKGGDLDLATAAFSFNGNQFHFASTSNANIGTTAQTQFVWGMNRGAGTAGFSSLGLSGVLFDWTLLINADGSGTYTKIGGGTTAFGAGTATIAGASLSFDLDAALVQSTGFAQTAYTAAVWSRDLSQIGNARIADFAPDNSNISVTVTPEPTSLLLMVPALVGVLVVRRRVHRVTRATVLLT